LWYNQTMNKEFLKEVGKFILDLTKVIFAIAIITPLVKDGGFHMAPIAFGTVTAIFGMYILKKGVEDE